jgi:phosphopantothenoylcysteine synthetase/decarboxylase
VANDLAQGIFNSTETRAFVIDNEGSRQIKKTSKRNAAKAIWDEIDRRL